MSYQTLTLDPTKVSHTRRTAYAPSHETSRGYGRRALSHGSQVVDKARLRYKAMLNGESNYPSRRVQVTCTITQLHRPTAPHKRTQFKTHSHLVKIRKKERTRLAMTGVVA